MVINFKVFKKSSPNGKVNLYMGKRDFIDHISAVEPVEGIVVLDNEYIRDHRKIFGQIVCSFRYGREEDEVMGLNFQKELFLASEQIYPPQEKSEKKLSKIQERLMKKLGDGAVIFSVPVKTSFVIKVFDINLKVPFNFNIPVSAPASITLQQAKDETGEPCGVQYYVKIFAGDSETDRTHRRSTVCLGIRKVQFAPSKQGNQPCTGKRAY